MLREGIPWACWVNPVMFHGVHSSSHDGVMWQHDFGLQLHGGEETKGFETLVDVRVHGGVGGRSQSCSVPRQ